MGKGIIMKIVFIGAGNAALVAAEKLARGGVECTVFEKSAYEDLSYDWHDDINPSAWEEYGLPAPKDGTHFTKRNWTFIPPSAQGISFMTVLSFYLSQSVPLCAKFSDL